MDIAASGGYYIATAADRISAHPTTITGSIGVIVVKFNVKGYGQDRGAGGVNQVRGYEGYSFAISGATPGKRK